MLQTHECCGPEMNPSNQLKKPNTAIAMTLVKGSLTTTGRKIFNVLLHRTQIEYFEVWHKDVDSIPATHFFSMPVAELIDFINSNRSEFSDNSPMKIIRGYFDELLDARVEWYDLDEKSIPIDKAAHLISERHVPERLSGSDQRVHWQFPPTVLKTICDPDLFTSIDLEQMAKLKSYASLALFEICSKFQRLSQTCRNPPEWWVDKLTRTAKRVDPKTGLPVRPEWRQLKSNTISKSIEEINEKTNLTIALKEHKTGKAVSEIQFFISKKKAQDARLVDKDHLELINHAARLDVDVSTHLRSSNVAEIEFVLSRFEGRLSSDKDEIKNKQAYFNKMMLETPTMVMTTTPPPLPALPFSDSPSTTNQESIHIFMNAKFDLLDEPKKVEYAAMVAEDLKRSGDTKLLLKLQEGIFNNGILRSRLTNKYATELFGPNWATDPATREKIQGDRL